MGSIRRKLGGFAVAAVIAAGMMIVPAQIEAKSKGGDTLGAFCSQLASAIVYLDGLDNAAADLVQAQLEATFAAYCR
jgi:hypothetical protein